MASQLFLYNAGTTLLGCGLDGIGRLLATTGSYVVKVNTASGACSNAASISGDNRGITSIATSSTASYVFVGSNNIYEYLDNNGSFSNTINVASGDTVMALTGKLVNSEYRCYYYPATNAGVLKYLQYGSSTIHTVNSSGTSLVLSGLTEMGGYFYGCGGNDHTIYKIDYTTGIATVVLVADSSITWRYITNDGTNLYACAQGVGAYIINPTTLAMSLISVGASAHSWHGIAYLNAKLYMTSLDGYIIGISNPASATYMTEPTATPISGCYYTTQLCTLSADSGASIYYTTDGSTPSKSSTLYSAPFALNGIATLKIIAYSGYNNTSVVTYNYTYSKYLFTLLGANTTANTYLSHIIHDASNLITIDPYGSGWYSGLLSNSGVIDIKQKYAIGAKIGNYWYNLDTINLYVYDDVYWQLNKTIPLIDYIDDGGILHGTTGIITDGSNLYYISGNYNIFKVDTTSGQVSNSLGKMYYSATYLNGYWYSTASYGAVYKTNLTAHSITTVLNDLGGFRGLTTDGIYLYITTNIALYQYDPISGVLKTLNTSSTNPYIGTVFNNILYGTNSNSLYSLDLSLLVSNNYASLGGAWKKISTMYVSQAGVWKTVSKLYKAESGAYVEKI